MIIDRLQHMIIDHHSLMRLERRLHMIDRSPFTYDHRSPFTYPHKIQEMPC